MIIYQVEPQHIDLVWSSVAPLLKKPLETGLEEVGLDDIKEWLKNQRQQLWLFLDEEEQKIIGACTTQIIIYPNKRHLQIHLVGAKKNKLGEWMKEWPSVAADFCKKNNDHKLDVSPLIKRVASTKQSCVELFGESLPIVLVLGDGGD